MEPARVADKEEGKEIVPSEDLQEASTSVTIEEATKESQAEEPNAAEPILEPTDSAIAAEMTAEDSAIGTLALVNVNNILSVAGDTLAMTEVAETTNNCDNAIETLATATDSLKVTRTVSRFYERLRFPDIRASPGITRSYFKLDGR